MELAAELEAVEELGGLFQVPGVCSGGFSSVRPGQLPGVRKWETGDFVKHMAEQFLALESSLLTLHFRYNFTH